MTTPITTQWDNRKTGVIKKMQVELLTTSTPVAGGTRNTNVGYHFCLDDERINMNALIGQPIKLISRGEVHCLSCGRLAKKSFAQGHCYPCFQKKASCDLCIMKPETCHFHKGTCREPLWGVENCMIEHVVYLANSSGIKVGITRHSQVPTRWIDQGAIQAIPLLRVKMRYHSGLAEKIIGQYVTDKTAWQRMLKADPEERDMVKVRDYILQQAGDELLNLDEKLTKEIGEQALFFADEELSERNNPVRLHYPVLSYPEKIKSLNLDKTPEITGVLHGIKGQYLMLDTGVINIRKYGGYKLSLLF